ncbi:MAG: GNAT family N-acetyltransferase [Marmoricola sp.]
MPGLVASSQRLFAEDAGTRDPSANLDWPAQHGSAVFAMGITDPARLILVVDDGTIAGHLSGVVEEPTTFCSVRTATLRSLYVAPRLRSRGFGGELIKVFSVWAEEQRAEQLEVTAYASNEDAIRFYTTHGFAPLSMVLRRSP